MPSESSGRPRHRRKSVGNGKGGSEKDAPHPRHGLAAATAQVAVRCIFAFRSRCSPRPPATPCGRSLAMQRLRAGPGAVQALQPAKRTRTHWPPNSAASLTNAMRPDCRIWIDEVKSLLFRDSTDPCFSANEGRCQREPFQFCGERIAAARPGAYR